MKSLSPFIRKIILAVFRYLIFHINTIFVFDFAVDLPYFTLMAAITSIYHLVLTYISVLDFAIKGCGYLFLWDSRHQRMDYRIYFDSNVVLM
jgi:hypothetical protein